ncbi:MAG: sugar ABC transporter permease [Clostridiaceae bacterium]|nr:sugar ABC transporter permease [Clostridiaceae bacterium]
MRQKAKEYFKRLRAFGKRHNGIAYVYMIPAAFGTLFFTILPFIFMIIAAFFKVDLVNIQESRYVGTWNFMMVFTRDNEFTKAVVNTIIFAFVTVILLMFVTILMASWLAKNTKVHNFAQTLIFTPHISSMVSVAILWVLLLDPRGIINQILALFGIQGPAWLLDSRTSLISVALVTVWKSIGYYCLIIIAGLQALPPEVYEAARLDKASRWCILRKITLPLLTPTLSFVFIMKFINSFKAFAAIDIMTQGGPQGSSMVLGYWIYNAGRVKFNYGFSMVGAIVLTVLVAVLTYLAQRFFNRRQ